MTINRLQTRYTSGVDWCSEKGAKAAAKLIREMWAQYGIKVETRIEEVAGAGRATSESKPIYAVRSDLKLRVRP